MKRSTTPGGHPTPVASRWLHHPRWIYATLLVATVYGCGDAAVEEAADPSSANEAPLPTSLPVDSSVAVAPLGSEGWEYGRASEVDVDGDGAAERVVVAARAEVVAGRPAWDDGQAWQVYVEEESGERTVLFARFVQLGSVTARVTLDGDESPSSMLILEHVPDRMELYEIAYGGPGEAVVRGYFQRRLHPLGELASPPLP